MIFSSDSKKAALFGPDTAAGRVPTCLAARVSRCQIIPHHIVQRGHNRDVVFAEDDDFLFYLENLAQWKANLGSANGVEFRCASLERSVRATRARDRLMPHVLEILELRAGLPELEQHVDQVQHVDRAVLVDVLPHAAGDGRLAEAKQ